MLADLESRIRLVPDFPQPGILFRDISPLLKTRLNATIEAMADLYSPSEWQQFDAVVGIESRGFILASALAYAREKELLLVRKPGKLPPPVHKVAYTLEYGQDALEMSSQFSGARVLVVDDVLATGGTLRATCELCEASGHQVAAIVTLIDLKALNDFRWGEILPRACFRY